MNLTPGIYKGTVRGVPDVTLMALTYGDLVSVVPADGLFFHPSIHITDARRLYTLDLEDPAEAVWLLRESHLTFIADQIEAQIPKPPRMAEPGWGEKVTASTEGNPTRRTWLHFTTQLWRTSDNYIAPWDNLIDPVLIREGVTS